MGMLDVLRRRWKYLAARADSRFEQTADPKIQLEQAIAEARNQHRQLVEQAASVVANQKQNELALSRAIEELAELESSARSALSLAEAARQEGDQAKAAQYEQAAEMVAAQLVATEGRVAELKELSLSSARAAEQARAAVAQNSLALQQKLAERQKLLSQLDQAKMQEQLNRAMASLSDTTGTESPSLDQVRAKIEARYAKAYGVAELSGQSVQSRILELRRQTLDNEAKKRLEAIRGELDKPSQPQLGEGDSQEAAQSAADVDTADERSTKEPDCER